MYAFRRTRRGRAPSSGGRRRFVRTPSGDVSPLSASETAHVDTPACRVGVWARTTITVRRFPPLRRHSVDCCWRCHTVAAPSFSGYLIRAERGCFHPRDYRDCVLGLKEESKFAGLSSNGTARKRHTAPRKEARDCKFRSRICESRIFRI